MRKRLGQYLIEKGLVTQFQLQSALEDQKNFGNRLGDILVSRGYVSEGELIENIAEWRQIKFVDLSEVPPSKTAIATLNKKFCKEHIVYPIRLKQQGKLQILFVALSDTFDLGLLDQIKFHTNVYKVEPVLASVKAIEACIQRDYDNINLMIPKLNYDKNSQFDELSPIDEDLIIETGSPFQQNNEPKNYTPQKATIPEEYKERIILLEAEIETLKEKMEQYKKMTSNLLKMNIRKGIITKEEYYKILKDL